MEPSVQTDRVAEYLTRLRPHLDDLDPAERAEVLDELADALREVAAENDGPLEALLGPPAEYVAAYRASAGLQPRQPRSQGRLRTMVDGAVDTLRAQPWWPRASALFTLLRPAWWTLRGAVLALLAGAVILRLEPWAIDTLPVILCVVAGVTASLAVAGGRRDTRAGRLLITAANMLAIWTALWLLGMGSTVREDIWDAGYRVGMEDGAGAVSSPDDQHLTMPGGELVTNIYPYTRDGEPLDDVLLYDGAGQPLTLVPPGEQLQVGIETVYQRDADGQPIANLYPLEQFAVEYDGTGAVVSRRPRRAPTIVLPPALRADDAASAEPTDTPSDTGTGAAAGATEPAADATEPVPDAREPAPDSGR